jgi:hypothetical protein
MAILWGVPMTLILAFTDSGLSLSGALAAGTIGAVMFAGAMSLFFRRLISQLYTGGPPLVPTPPEGTYAFRMLSSLSMGPILKIGGHLYAGPSQLVFVPHLKNREKDRVPRVLPWERVERIEEFARPSPWLARLIVPGPMWSLRVVGGGEEWLLEIPNGSNAAEALRRFMPPQ